jgi:hypothetical protein
MAAQTPDAALQTWSPENAGQAQPIDIGVYAGSDGGNVSEFAPEDSLSVIPISLLSRANVSSRREA